ncbi:MAG: hypothetical protein J4G18_09570, partial [Anaerolineae bacterium]|nr:hypothetical protein [Anaerolineae bacterium]
MAYVYLTAQFKSDLDQLDSTIKGRVSNTVDRINRDPYYPGLETHPHRQVHHRKILRSRVNDNFRVLWEWAKNGNILLWRVGKHEVIDRIDDLPVKPSERTQYFTRDDKDHSAIELEGLVVSRDLPQPFQHVPLNILRLFGVPDELLDAVKS